MDKRKLIGTIIGVAMFAALIAGATFAWLTFNATVTNATYNGTTMNFIVNYSNGQSVTNIPQLTSGTPNTASCTTVNAKKNTNSVDGTLTIKLSTTSNGTLTQSGALKWTICKGGCGTGNSFPNGATSGQVGDPSNTDITNKIKNATTSAPYIIIRSSSFLGT